MRRFLLQALQALAVATAWASSQQSNGSHSDMVHDVQELGKRLSPEAMVIPPWSKHFDEATARWSTLAEPQPNVVVLPATAEDAAKTVKFAHTRKVPFLTYNGVHGAITTLGNMDYGIELSVRNLTGVQVAPDGKTARIAGGTMSKTVTDALWAAGKQTVTGTCECVSYIGPALGGGHGWLQGRHGLIADQIEAMDVVLADGSMQTLDRDSALMWAMKGAGHNFAVVTSITARIYDIVHPNWASETIIFSGNKAEAVYRTANQVLIRNGSQPLDIQNWSYWLNQRSIDPDNPVIVFYILQEGVSEVDSSYTQPFHDLGPLSVFPKSGTYRDLAAWTGVSESSAPCQKNGNAHPRFPIYLQSYNPSAQQQAYDLYAAEAGPASPFSASLFMFEGYPTEGVKAVDPASTAFAFREDNLLTAPLINYDPDASKTIIDKAARLGNDLREILKKGSGRDELHTYVNYAYGDETTRQWYGYEDWRQERLHQLKDQFDPTRKFRFFAPVEKTE
ncbi:FAD binding domain-containing protein [Aspergillus sp. HF37]|nr:FAD binding domain-containing protein [Aspergillus sp. HF37]